MTTQNNVNGYDLGAGEEFDPQLAAGIDPESVEGSGPSFPLIQWTYGDRKMKALGSDKMGYSGGWFINADMVDPATMVAAGWTKETFTHANGSETEGFYRRQIAISMIAARQRWEVTDAAGNRTVFPWTGYDAAKAVGRAVGRMHILCIVKDLESLGPVVLTLKGAASKAFKGSRNAAGVETKFNNTVIAAANAAAVAKGIKSRWAYRAFWCPVGADRDASGNPVFTEVGSTKTEVTHLVLPIALGLPEKAAGVDLKRFFVGAAMLETVNALYAEYGEWRVAWDANRMEAGAVEGNGNGTGSGSGTPEQPAPVGVDVLAETGL